MKTEKISAKVGETFQVAGIEFIRFPETAEGVPVVAKAIQKEMVFGENNDLRNSKVLAWLREEFLPKIVAAIGEENLVSFKTDLTTWDGLKNYGVVESKVSIPTMDFYRDNVEVFDKYPVKRWWWLATPDSCQLHCDPDWILCVAPSGYIYVYSHDYFYSRSGVRPFLILKSSIFESLEDE